MLLLVVGTLAASTIAAVTGFGGAAVLLPFLVAVFGVRDAIPALTIAQLVGNGSRGWFNRAEVNYQVVGWFALGSLPAGLLGGVLFASAPLPILTRLLGGFLLLVVVFRHVQKLKMPQMRLRWFAPLGILTSFLSAVVGTAGPIVAPFFLAFGLVKGAYIGTEALSAVVMHASKLVAYSSADVLSMRGLAIGLLLGPILILGSFVGKKIVNRVPDQVFVMLIEIVLLVSGALLLVHG